MRVDRILALNTAQSVGGWMREQQLLWLYDTAAALGDDRPRTWAEVGVWMGRSLSAVVCGIAAGSTVYAVDHFQGSEDEFDSTIKLVDKMGGTGELVGSFNKTRARLAELRPDVEIVVMQMDSLSAASGCPNAAFDAIFIDAAHTTEAVLHDVRAWKPKLRDSGLLCGHDIADSRVLAGLRQADLNVRAEPCGIWVAT